MHGAVGGALARRFEAVLESAAMNDETTQPAIRIGADGIDVHAVEKEILASVEEKRARGVYDDAAVARAERNNLLTLKDDESFMERYLLCLRQIVPVDINDFEILERRSRLAPLSKAVKKTIWKLLKFYTYRLWSQQNQINGIVITAVESIEQQFSARIDALEKRVAALESAAKPPAAPHD